MTPIFILDCEIPTKLFMAQRTFIVPTVEDAQKVRDYVKSLGGNVRRHRIDYVFDFDNAKDAIDHEVRECNRVAGMVA